uniref:Uncharacterized protein n=2 Tax=Setaria TaxID=4554 RepID=A0A0Q3N5C8_SETIT
MVVARWWWTGGLCFVGLWRLVASGPLVSRLVWRSAGPYVGGVESCSLGEEEAPVPGLLLHCRPPPLPHLSLH